jgi:hypothetical protein
MFIHNRFCRYRKAGQVLTIKGGPAAWLIATWSYSSALSQYEVTIQDSNGFSFGATKVLVEEIGYHRSVGLNERVNSGTLLWHPTGLQLAVVECGRVYLFRIDWMEENQLIPFRRADELYSARMCAAADMDNQSGQSKFVPGGHGLRAAVTLVRRSIYIGATTLAVSHTALLGAYEKHPPAGALEGLPGALLVGTDEGAILLMTWDDPAALVSTLRSEDEAPSVHRSRSGSNVSVAGSFLPAVVLVPAKAVAARLLPSQLGSRTSVHPALPSTDVERRD